MKKIRVNINKLMHAVCIVIPTAAATVFMPRAIKNVNRSKHACV